MGAAGAATQAAVRGAGGRVRPAAGTGAPQGSRDAVVTGLRGPRCVHRPSGQHFDQRRPRGAASRAVADRIGTHSIVEPFYRARTPLLRPIQPAAPRPARHAARPRARRTPIRASDPPVPRGAAMASLQLRLRHPSGDLGPLEVSEALTVAAVKDLAFSQWPTGAWGPRAGLGAPPTGPRLSPAPAPRPRRGPAEQGEPHVGSGPAPAVRGQVPGQRKDAQGCARARARRAPPRGRCCRRHRAAPRPRACAPARPAAGAGAPPAARPR
jgi:hypothetical protein